MRYTVYCDESRHSFGNGAQYAVIGGLWIKTDARDAFSRKIREIRKIENINSEIKWSKVSSLKLESYLKLVDAFFEEDSACFRSIIVDQSKVDYGRHNGDVELGFYKFYYEMIEKWITNGNSYTILLDFKNNVNRNRLKDLKNILSNYGDPRGIVINELTCIDSFQSPIAQVCDLLTGAVAADANGISYGTPKQKFVERVSRLLKRSPLSAPSFSPAISKFNVFRISLGA